MQSERERPFRTVTDRGADRVARLDRDAIDSDRPMRIKLKPCEVTRGSTAAVRLDSDLLDSVRAVTVDPHPIVGIGVWCHCTVERGDDPGAFHVRNGAVGSSDCITTPVRRCGRCGMSFANDRRVVVVVQLTPRRLGRSWNSEKKRNGKNNYRRSENRQS